MICTKGEPTDEFLGEDSALFIDNEVGETTFEAGVAAGPQHGIKLVPDADYLASLMDRMISDDRFRKRARRAGSSCRSPFDLDAFTRPVDGDSRPVPRGDPIAQVHYDGAQSVISGC